MSDRAPVGAGRTGQSSLICKSSRASQTGHRDGTPVASGPVTTPQRALMSIRVR
jgi:hypothetical protein